MPDDNVKPSAGTVSLKPSDAAVELATPSNDELEANECWYYPSSNSKGNNHSVHYRVAPETGALVGEIIAARRFPYKTDSHLYRHALARHLAFLSRFKGFPAESLYAQQLMLDKYMQQHEHNQQFIQLITRMEQFVKSAMERNDRSAAVEMIEDMKRHVRKMEPPSWRRRYQREIDKISQRMLGTYTVEVKMLPPGNNTLAE